MGIKGSAQKHGITADDINHALANPIYVHYLDGYQMIIGASTTAQLLEIGVNEQGDVFHAMPARPKYLRTR